MCVITEDFSNALGQFINYDTNDILLYDSIKNQKHIDFRVLSTEQLIVPANIFDIDGLFMSALNADTIANIEDSSLIFIPLEAWTTSGVSLAYGRTNGRSSIALTCTGTTGYAESIGELIDFSDFAPTDFFSLACPSFPTLGHDGINLTSSTVTLTREDNSTVILTFQSGVQMTGGDAELRWPISALGSNLAFKTIRITIVRTDLVTDTVLTINAIRVLSSNWTPMKMDINTHWKRLEQTVTKVGTTPSTVFPQVWRSSATPSLLDPKPFNSRLAVNFYTGANTATNSSFTIFLRGRREDFLTQLDLDGLDDGTLTTKPSIGENQWSLEQKHRQPDYGLAVYNPRFQEDLDALVQSDISYDPPTDTTPALTQAELERISDTISESWIEVTLVWNSSGATVTIGTTETLTDPERYIYTGITLTQNTRYTLFIDNEDNTIQVQIIPIEVSDKILYEDQVFDSGQITNDFVFPRRKGRIGYVADLHAAGSWIDGILTRGLMYGELVTNTFSSLTPAIGAQIFSIGTKDIILNTSYETIGTPTQEIDTHNSRSDDGALKLTTEIGQGIRSTLTNIEDFAHTEVVFDIYVSKTSLVNGPPFAIGLAGEHNFLMSLLMPNLSGDQWQNCRIPLVSASNNLPGNYRFFLITVNPSTVWIDNLAIVQSSIAWSARATSDAWDAFEDNWLNFNKLIDNDSYGVLFGDRGTLLQVRGQTLLPNITIDKAYFKPKYAEIGRLIWNSGRVYTS